MLSNALVLLLLLSYPAASAPTGTSEEPFPTPHLFRHCSSSSYGRCSNWNPFQCRVTEIITRTVVQHFTSTVYVAVEAETDRPTVTLPYDIVGEETHNAYITMPQGSFQPSPVGETATAVPLTEDTLVGVPTNTIPEIVTFRIDDPDCVNCVYYFKSSPRTSSDGVVSIWATKSHQSKEHPTGVVSIWSKVQGQKAKPTGVVSIWMEEENTWDGANAIAEPNLSITEAVHGRKQPIVGSQETEGDKKSRCLKREKYTYTANFDDLNAPYIPKPYNGLNFTDHFSVFDPSLIYSNYTAPSPPFAVQSYPSRSNRITSHTPFDLISMYVGCEYAQACLIRIRGWSPSRVYPAEMHVRVTDETENWVFVKFFKFGFNQITTLEFDVLDLSTGTRDTLGLTVDEIVFRKEVFEMQDCLE